LKIKDQQNKYRGERKQQEEYEEESDFSVTSIEAVNSSGTNLG